MIHSWLVGTYTTHGLAGTLIILAGALITALFYHGKEGERYKITRHFISELGEQGVSRLALVFNAALILAGLFFTLMLIGVALALDSTIGYVAMASGLVTSLACVFVGIFPMNKIKPHTIAALTYFRSGLVTVLLFSVAILLQPADHRVIPLYALVFGVLSFLAYAAFLIYMGNASRKQSGNVLDTENLFTRPGFWWMPFLEWLVLISTLLWFLVICTAR